MRFCAELYPQAWKEGNDSVAQYMLRNITGKLLLLIAVPRRVPRPSDHLRRPR